MIRPVQVYAKEAESAPMASPEASAARAEDDTAETSPSPQSSATSSRATEEPKTWPIACGERRRSVSSS